jgi:acyl carrier protein
MSTLDTLQDIVVADFKLSRAQLTPDSQLSQLGIDSLDVLELMFKIEDRFGLKIKDDIPTSLVTLADVVAYIDTLLEQQARTSGSRVTQLDAAS